MMHDDHQQGGDRSPERILVVNPGSTSTKIALFAAGGGILHCETFRHSVGDLGKFATAWDQLEFRLALCRRWAQQQAAVGRCSAVVTVGGLLRPLPGGTYAVNDRMLADARMNLQGEHVSNLGCALAAELARELRCPAFVVDPVSVDEFDCLASYSGHPAIRRRSLSHALNIHAVARRAAAELGVAFSGSSFVVGHLGGGISIAPVRDGKIIDANDAASDGPFSPERSGGLPLQALVTLCFRGDRTQSDIRSMIMGKGGLAAYLGTNAVEEVERRIAGGDQAAAEVYRAMAYQIAKEIGAMATVLNGSVRAIVLTGGAAHSAMLTGWISERVRFIAPVVVYPGGDEMQSLAEGALRALRGEEQVKEY